MSVANSATDHFESQAFRASGLNLVVSAIVHWNTVYIERAVTHLRKMHREIPDHLLKQRLAAELGTHRTPH